MKVKIWGEPGEIDAKREKLLKHFAGDDYEIIEKSSKRIRKPFYLAHKQMLDHWDERYGQMLKEMKKEIADVLES